MANIDYTVPGLIVPLQQRSSMSCWATMYTMMLSWNQQQSFDERAAIAALGPTYLNAYDLNTGLPIESNRDLANAAGMVAEPLFNPSITGWYNLLLNYGLLWTSFAWRSGATSGRHIIILYGIFGDGTPTGTQVRYVDPSDGQTHTMSFMQFFPQHELGFTITALRDPMLVKFSQIMHYP
jgi:hypothetical protein